MRILLIVIGFLVALFSAPVAAGAQSGEQGPAIQVLEGGWGNAYTEDIEAVLHSVASELGRYFPGWSPMKLVIKHSEKGPLTLYQKGPKGEYLILLSARDRRWAQYAYQFSHELCHVLSNYDHSETNNRTRSNQWFEEALCEAAALFTLGRMAITWESNPPFPHWRDYAQVLRHYAERLAGEAHRRLPHDTMLVEWYAANQEALRDDPYLRDKNEVCANMMLALFERSPEHWAAIGYLNRDSAALTGSLSGYLQSWHRAAPGEHRAFIAQVIGLFAAPDGGARVDLAFLEPGHDSRGPSHR
jgi:hypothetical protein